MGLKDTIQGLANSAITSFIGDLSSTAVLRSTTQGAYNTTTGVVTTTTVTHTVTCLSTNLTQYDVLPIDVVATGRKLLVPALQLVGVNVDALDDSVVVDGVPWTVFEVKLDPAGALYTFILRARQGTKL